MANEYRLASTYVEALRSSPVSNARLVVAYVEVVRTVNPVAGTRRRQVMVGSF